LVLMSVELMLNAVNLNLVAFDVWLRDALFGGQMLALFVIVVAAAEVGLGLAIVLLVYRARGAIGVDQVRGLGEVVTVAADGAGDPRRGDGDNGGPRTVPGPQQGSPAAGGSR
ncbi:MAG: NADH-quinone oxidoreductase subunit NuoK, partial [Acidothermales bacterium]|nr:NADH-quinone oxidoreductase subunit NuoK [Acidothermales bacterium]